MHSVWLRINSSFKLYALQTAKLIHSANYTEQCSFIVGPAKLQALIGLFDSVADKVFCENSSEDVLNVVKQFWKRTEELEDDCIMFLDTKFTRLRSALSAFQMLKDFTTTASRPRINVKLGEKFVDILKHFSM